MSGETVFLAYRQTYFCCVFKWLFLSARMGSQREQALVSFLIKTPILSGYLTLITSLEINLQIQPHWVSGLQFIQIQPHWVSGLQHRNLQERPQPSVRNSKNVG